MIGDIFYKVMAECFRYGIYGMLFIIGFAIGLKLDIYLSFQ